MALTLALLGAATFNTTAGVKTVVATPTAGDMIVVVVAATGVAAGLGVSDNNADGHGNYTQIVSALKSTSADLMAAFVRADPVRSATSTTFTTSGDGASTGGGLAVIRITGAFLAGAAFIRNTGSQANQASGTPAVPMGSAVLTANAVVAAFFDTTNAAPTLTAPTGFAAAIVNTNYNTPTTGWQINTANSGITASTITWGTAAPSAFSDLAFELRADLGGKQGEQHEEHGDPFSHQSITRGAQLRSSTFCLGEKWARKGRLWIPAADRPFAIA